MLLRRSCCLCAWWVSLESRRRQQNLVSEAWLLPLRLVGFIGTSAEAAKSCFQGAVAAFALGVFHGIYGGGSKILLPRRICCLCAWWVSRTRWRRQQNPAFCGAFAAFALGGHRVCGRSSKNLLPAVHLLPLVLVGFIGSTAKAAKSCFRGAFAAFALGEFHGVCGGGSKILLPSRVCCLWAWWVSSGHRRRQQISNLQGDKCLWQVRLVKLNDYY